MRFQTVTKILAACILLPAMLCSCEQGSKVNDDGSISITRNGKTKFSIVESQADPASIGESLAAAFKDLTGAEVSVANDNSKSRKYEIVIGETGRKESGEARSKIGGNGYTIEMNGTKIAIAGSNSTWTSLALKEFETKVLKNPLYNKDGNITLPGDFSVVQDYDDPQLIARLVKSGVDFSLNPTLVMNCPGDEGIGVAQGAASDGKHFYFLNRSRDDGMSVVYKYDMKSLFLVGKSKVFNCGHANDATFDFSKNRFIAAHGHSEGKIITPLDAETLEVQPNIDIPVGSGAITYNKSKESYAISQGGRTLYIADKDFNVLSSYTRTDNSVYLAQGMGSDDYYIYFPMSPLNGKTDNVLVTYDWNGNYITDLHIPMDLESESMFYSDGNYYVNFYLGKQTGAGLYRIDPEYNYKYTK